jgi:crotonobetainyl-CoA:carnitine CoA-transferase CaiB-like acyl-CoA transferase
MKLAGVRVLELASFIPGPYLTLAMADHGAEVIKVEAPGEGDPARHIGLRDGVDSVFFRNFNRGKKSIVLNLKDSSDREAFLRLAETADVIVESSRPGVAARLGVDYDTINARNPRIVYCSISAFGQDGPNAGRAAHDLALEGIAGVLSTNLGSDRQPSIPATANADFLSALHGLAAVLMALYARHETGRGDYIDISMQEAVIGGLLNVLGPTLAENRQPIPEHERSTGGSAFYRIYATSDGRQVVLGGQEMKFVRTLLGALGGLELAALCEQGPGPHQQPVVDFLQARFAEMDQAEAMELLGRLDVCWAPVNTLVEALDDPQLAARRFILNDELGRRHIGCPIRFRDEPASPSLIVPELGESSGRIAHEKGHD